MLKLCLQGGVPLIGVTTRDPINCIEALQYVVKDLGLRVGSEEDVRGIQHSSYDVIVLSNSSNLNYAEAYEIAVANDKIVVLVNSHSEGLYLVDCGEFRTPLGFIMKGLIEAGWGGGMVESLKTNLTGMTLAEASIVCNLAHAKYGVIDSKGFASLRNHVVDSFGVIPVDSTEGYYYPPPKLMRYTDTAKYFFSLDIDRRIRPRGLMLQGRPGTGKSKAAKYIADIFKVPLYVLEVPSIMSKYIGESESNMRHMLRAVDMNAPCVLLLDELDKLFGGVDESGVSQRLLSQLLWWLEEHSTLVFTVATSNVLEKLPKELYRPGRLDEVLVFDGVAKTDALKLGNGFLRTFDYPVRLTKEDIAKICRGRKRVTPAVIIQHATSKLKSYILGECSG